jgi:hypothetical protein
MSLRTTVLSVFLILVATTALAGDRMNPKSLDWRMEELIRLADQEVGAIDDLIEAADRPAVRKELHRKTEELAALLAEIRSVGRDLAAVAAEPVVIVHETEVVLAPKAQPTECSPMDFDQVYRAVDAESFSDDKVRVLKSAVIDRWFTVAQVKKMMGTTAFGGEKVQIAALMHPRVVDMNNWFTVYGALTFDSEKTELRRLVGD